MTNRRRSVPSNGMKLLSILTLTAIAVITFPTGASAQDAEPAACPPGYVAVMSVGGLLCVNPIYLTGWEDDPASCEHGFYQGSCVPAPLPLEVPFAPEAYAYQPLPVASVVVAPVVADDTLCLIQRPC